jgi:hypothetical protein
MDFSIGLSGANQTSNANPSAWSGMSYSKQYDGGTFSTAQVAGGMQSKFTTSDGVTINNFFNADAGTYNGVSTDVESANLTTSQSDGLSNLISSGDSVSSGSGGKLMSYAQLAEIIGRKTKDKKSGGDGGASEGGGADVSVSANGSSLSGSITMGDVTLSGSIGGGYSSGGASAEDAIENNWFIQLAEALGEILNKIAKKLSAMVDAAKLGSDGQPPYKDAMRIQALAQELAFIQQALMTALNSVGESIKNVVTAGGAAR